MNALEVARLAEQNVTRRIENALDNWSNQEAYAAYMDAWRSVAIFVQDENTVVAVQTLGEVWQYSVVAEALDFDLPADLFETAHILPSPTSNITAYLRLSCDVATCPFPIAHI